MTAAVSFDLAVHFERQVIARVVTESHIRAFAGEYLAHCRTNATRSSSDERPLSLKQETHLAMFSPSLQSVGLKPNTDHAEATSLKTAFSGCGISAAISSTICRVAFGIASPTVAARSRE